MGKSDRLERGYMKLLVINLQNPCDTKYRSPKTIGSFMWGRMIDNYPMFTVDGKGNMMRIYFDTSEVTEIQDVVKAALAA